MAPKITFRNCLAASSETCEAPAPVNNTLAHALLGWHLTSLSVVTPQGFGYQTFLDWRTCPSHTAHQPGECDCSRLGLWVYRSLSLSSAKCHTAGPRHLTVHQQAPGKLLCISSAGSMARELLPTCCIQVLDKWIFYSRFFFFPSFSPGLSMPPFFFFLLSFDIFWKKNPSCQLPLQLRTNLKPALGFLRSIFTGQSSSSAQKFCPGSWREWDLRLDYICSGLQTYFPVCGNTQMCPTLFVRAKHSWTTLLQSGWWIFVLTSYM